MKQLALIFAVAILLTGCGNSLEKSLEKGEGISEIVVKEFDVLYCQKRVLDVGLEFSNIREELENIDKDLVQYEGELKDAESELNSAENLIQNVEKDLARARAKAKQEKIYDLEKEFQELKEDIDDANLELERALNNIERKTTERISIELLYDKQKETLDQIREECSDFEKDPSDELCSKFNSELDNEIVTLQASLDESQKNLEKWANTLKRETKSASQERFQEILNEIQQEDKDIQKDEGSLAKLSKMQNQIKTLCAKN